VHGVAVAEKTIRESFLPYALPSIGDEEITEVVDSLPYCRETHGYAPTDFPVAFNEFQRVVCLPICSKMSDRRGRCD
jgi:hypothetical protein